MRGKSGYVCGSLGLLGKPDKIYGKDDLMLGQYGDGNYDGNTLIGLTLDTLVYFVADSMGMTESKQMAQYHANLLRENSPMVEDSWSQMAILRAFAIADIEEEGSLAYNLRAVMSIFRSIDENMNLGENGSRAFYQGEVESRFMEFLTGIELPPEGYQEKNAFSDAMVQNFVDLSDALYDANVLAYENGGKVYMDTVQDDLGRWSIRVRATNANSDTLYQKNVFGNLYP